MAKNKKNQAVESEQNIEKVQESNLNQINIDSLIAEKDDWKNKAMRFAADLQNSQRQGQIDIANNTKMTKKRVVNGLAQFLNTLYISFSFIPGDINDEGKKFIETLRFSFNSLVNDLKSINIDIIAPKKEDIFNPAVMSALNEGAIESNEKGFAVDNVVSIGFKVDNQVINPATVIVKNIDN